MRQIRATAEGGFQRALPMDQMAALGAAFIQPELMGPGPDGIFMFVNKCRHGASFPDIPCALR